MMGEEGGEPGKTSARREVVWEKAGCHISLPKPQFPHPSREKMKVTGGHGYVRALNITGSLLSVARGLLA